MAGYFLSQGSHPFYILNNGGWEFTGDAKYPLRGAKLMSFSIHGEKLSFSIDETMNMAASKSIAMSDVHVYRGGLSFFPICEPGSD